MAHNTTGKECETPVTEPTFRHGERVVYVGRTDRDFRVTQGRVYLVFGDYPQPPMKGATDRKELAIRVEDPEDDFGGVVSLPVERFRKAVL